MKAFIKIIGIFCLLIVTFSLTNSGEVQKYKCMIQMTNYTGEGAYVAATLIKPDGSYEKTLNISGKDAKWYPDLIHWHGFQKKSKQNLDGITGSSITGGQRSVCVLSIDGSKLNKGYKIRFESAVESQVYYKKDLELELKTENINQKIDGTGYIRYVRLMP